MHRLMILSALLVSATLFTPAAMKAADKRYYDRDGKDYHTWNKQEDRAYRVYLEGQHRPFVEFSKTKPAQQREYFKWRHDHTNETLFKVEIR